MQKDAAINKQKSGEARVAETYAPLDIADYLDSEETIIGYLAALLEEGDPRAFAAGLGDVARARGMSQIAVTLACRAKACTRRCPASAIRNWVRSWA